MRSSLHGASAGPPPRFRTVELRAPDADPSWGSVSFLPPVASEKASLDGEIDANIAYQLAVEHAVQRSWPIGTVMLAVADASSEWPYGGPTRRLVFVVRWEGVTWPGDRPALDEPARPGAVVGRQTVIIDANTGAFLGTSMAVDADPQRWVDRSKECDLATVWTRRPDMDATFIVKAGSMSRGLWYQVLEACTVPHPPELPARLVETGRHFAETLRLLDEVHGPVIGPAELADIIATLDHIIDTAERVVGRPLLEERIALTQAARAVLAR